MGQACSRRGPHLVTAADRGRLPASQLGTCQSSRRFWDSVDALRSPLHCCVAETLHGGDVRRHEPGMICLLGQLAGCSSGLRSQSCA